MNNSNNLILSDSFLNVNTNSNVTVDLYSDRLCIKNTDNKLQTLFLKDFAGYFIENFSEQNENLNFILNFYPKFKKHKFLRKCLSVELIYSKNNDSDINSIGLEHWKTVLDDNIRQKPFLVFVNPNSGSGQASKLLINSVLKVWNRAGLTNNTLVTTECKDYAKNYIKSVDLDKFKGIIVISGDGLVHEIFNGLIERKDWSKAIQTPIGQIGAGSANGLCCSLAFLANEAFENVSLENLATSTAFQLLKAQSEPLDLIRLELCNRKILHAFLNVEWCIIADVDLESENYRYLGGARFFVGMIKRLLSYKTYRGRISFLPSDDMKDYKPKNPSIKIVKNTENYKSDSYKNPSKFNHMTPLDMPVPNDWLTIEDSFSLFLIANLPLIGQELFVTPNSSNDDGVMYLIFVKSDVPRYELVKMFTQGSTGNFLNNRWIEFVKCKAFRLEPFMCVESKKQEGNLMVDGEPIEYGPLQGEISPKLASILLNRYIK